MKLGYRILLGIAVIFIMFIVIGSLISEEKPNISVKKVTTTAVSKAAPAETITGNVPETTSEAVAVKDYKDYSDIETLEACYEKAEECGKGDTYKADQLRGICHTQYSIFGYCSMPSVEKMC